MGWDIDQTIGKLHRLWWWCLDFAPDGNVSRHSADMVALAIGIPADMGDKLINSLFEVAFLDKIGKNQYVVHDWLEYAGRYLRDTKFRRNPEKMQEVISLHKNIVSRHSADKEPKRGAKSAVPNIPDLPNLPNIIKHKKGEYGHVLLTDAQMEKLREKFGSRLDHWIKTLDEGIQQKGYSYKDHYLTILKWSDKDDKSNAKGIGNSVKGSIAGKYSTPRPGDNPEIG